MDDFKGYPTYQYSIFLKNGKDEQIVIRTNTFNELIEAKKNVNKILDKVEEHQETPTETKPALKTFVCPTCGAPAEYREGKSAKNGKEWRAIFCSKEKEHVKWL